MPKAMLVSKELIHAMFEALDILGKIDRHDRTTEERRHVPATNPRFLGGTSCYGIHRRNDGTHVATTHIIRMPDGTEPHRHGKDILLGTLKFAQDTE
jgi:hypothetical protein